jgi:hypothetical protein
MTKVKQMLIEEPYEVKFGSTLLASAMEAARLYFICGLQSNNFTSVYATTDSLVYKAFIIASTAFANIQGKSPDFTNANLTPEQAMMNLGKMAIKSLNGNTLFDTIAKFDTAMLKKADGTACADGNGYLPVLRQMWFTIGADLKNYIGEWSSVVYERENEALGGVMLLNKMWLTLHTWHFITYHTLIRDMGTYVKDGDVVRGTYRQFNAQDPETYGAALLERVNGVQDYFGLSESDIDNLIIRGYEIPIIDGAYELGMRFFSRSKFPWRFGRFVEVIPLFFMNLPQANSYMDLIEADDINFSEDHSCHPFIDGDDTTWSTYLTAVTQYITKIKAFFFKNKQMASLKEEYKMVNFFDLPTWGTGTGGQLIHQITHWDEDGLNDDNLCSKWTYQGAADDYQAAQLQPRRQAKAGNVFQIIGDVSIEDYLTALAMNAIATYNYDGSTYTLGGLESFFEPKGVLMFGYAKTEDEPYMLDPTPVDISEYEQGSDDPCVTPQDWDNTTFTEDPISGRADYLDERASDPYKKLNHKLFDSAEMDFENLRLLLLEAFGYKRGEKAVEVLSEIPVSAIESEDEEDFGEKKKKFGDDEELPVSAKVDPADAKKKKEEHKKKMEEQAEKKKEKEEKKEKAKEKAKEDKK